MIIDGIVMDIYEGLYDDIFNYGMNTKHYMMAFFNQVQILNIVYNNYFLMVVYPD